MMKSPNFFLKPSTSQMSAEGKRQQRLLTILLFGTGAASLLGIIYGFVLDVTTAVAVPNTLYVGGFTVLAGVFVIYLISYYWSITVAGAVFVLLLVSVLTFGDDPLQVVTGRTLFMFGIPILISSVILKPYASFMVAGLIAIIFNIIVVMDSRLIAPVIIEPSGLFVIALVAWLAARSLEKALQDLQKVNDQLVQQSAALQETNQLLRDENMKRQRAEMELAEQAQTLQRTNAELQQFAYVSTHDLREPLRKVRSYAELLERRYKEQLDERAHKYIEYIVGGATRMQVLITALLAYLGVDRKEMAFEDVDLNTVLGEIVADLEAEVQGNTAVITHDLLPIVKADFAQMKILLQNLLSNGLKFRGAEPPRIHVAAQQQANEWLFSVTDNGLGIEPQYLERIFVIFQRLHAPETYPGTGIGLAICKKVVENHNGRIWLTSTPGHGTIFYFTLPV